MAAKIVGVTSGCFDMFHQGHLVYLQRCRSFCDQLVVAVDSDELVKAVKGDKRPLIPEEERLDIISNVSVVQSAVILRKVEDLNEVVLQFKAKRFFKSATFLEKKFRREMVYGLQGTGAELVTIPDITGVTSTTKLIARICERYKS